MPEGPELCSGGGAGGGGGSAGNGNGSVDGDLRARCVALEKAYVHEVYRQLSANNNNISQTAGPGAGTITASAPAPKLLANVTAFLSELEPTSVVADVGCGPGRYLSCRPDLAVIGVDACWGMAEQCRQRARMGSHDALCADNLRLPLRDETFDAVLSVAVVHHFASKERRIEALRELARITRIGGRVLITVWAMDSWQSQSDAVGRRFESQDILVPYRQPSICPACHHNSSQQHSNNYVQTALLNNLAGSAYSANGSSTRLQKQLRRSCAVSYSTATSEDDCQSERDCSFFNRPRYDGQSRLRRWVFTRGRSLEDSCSSDQSSPSDTCYTFVRRAVQRLSSASSSESRRSYFHKVCRRPWLTDSTDSGTGINVSLSSAERMSESPDLFEEEAHSERHDVSKSESFDSDDLCEDDGFIELRNLDPESPEEEYTRGKDPKDRISPLPPTGGLKHRSRSLGDMFSMIPSLLVRSRRRRSARNVDLQKRASTVSDPREYLLRSKDKTFVSRSSSTTSEGFMRFDYFRFMKGLSPESSINGNSSPTPIVEERLEATEESEPLLRVSDEESLNAVSPPPLWWMLDMQEPMPAVEIGFPATSAASDVSQSFTTLENPISQTAEAARAGPNSAIAKVAIGAHHPLGVSGIVEPASTAVTMVSAAASGGNVGISSNAGSGASFGGVTGRRSGERGKGQRQYAHEFSCTGPAPTKLLASKHQVQHCQEQLQKQQQLALAVDPATEAATLVVHSIQTTSPPIRGVTQAQVNQPHIDLASRRRLKFQGTRLQEKALRNRFTKKSSFDKLLRRRSIARSYFSMPNLNVFSAAFNERSPASHLRVLLKRPPAPDLSELELKLGIIDEHGNLKNPLRPAEHGGSISSHVPPWLPTKQGQSIEVGAGVGACVAGGSIGGMYGGAFGLPFSALPCLRSALNRRYSLSTVQGNSISFVPGIPSRSWVSKARHDSLKSDTSVESESDSVVSVIYRSKASGGSGGGNSGGGGLSDNSIDSEESIVSVIHRSTEDTPRAGSANGNHGSNSNRSWQASPLTISQTGSHEGSFSSPEYSPTLKSAPPKTEKVSCKLWETCLTEVDDEHASDARSVSPQPPSVSASALPSTSEPTNESTSIDQDRQGDVDSENIDRQTEDIEEMSPDTAEMLMELEREKENSPLLTPSSSSDDAPYMSDEEVQCEDIPESFELESTEALTAINAPIDLSRLQPPSSRRMCSPVDPLELEDDVLESIPEEDESCSPIKSPRSKQEDGTHFPMPAPEHYQSHNHQQLLLPQKSQPIRSNRVVTSAADTDPISTTVATTTLETVIATPAAASLSQRILASSNILLRSTPMLHVMSIDATVTTASVPAEKACKSYRRGHSGSNRSSGLAQPAELRHHLQLLATSTSSAVPGGDCDDRITAARPQEKSPTNKSSTLAASRNLKKVLADTEKAVVTLHSNVPEQKSSANSSSTTTSSCVDVCGMTVGSTGGSGPINSSSSSNSSGSSPLKPFCGLPSRFQQGDSNRRASDVGPQSKCPKERAQFSPQYSLPEQKKFQKELTASCEQLFRRRLSPQRQQEIRSDPLNELLRGSTKSVAGKPTLPEPALVGLQQQPLPQQWDDPRSRGGSISVSPEPLGLSVSRRRTPELRTSPLEMLAQELRSSSDDLYRRAAASTDHSQLAIDISQLVVDPSNPALLERRSSLRTSPDPRFEDATEDAVKSVQHGDKCNYWEKWLPEALSRIYAGTTKHDCDEVCDQLSELPEVIPQTTRHIGGRISAEGGILYSDRNSPIDICIDQEHLFLTGCPQATPPTSPEQFSDADESTASTTDQEISDLSSSLERLRVSNGLQPEITSAQHPNLNIVIEDFSDQGGSDAEISEACSSNAANSNVNQLYVQERQGGSSSLSDHSDRSSASIQTVFKLDTPSKEASPGMSLDLPSGEMDVVMNPLPGGDDADAQQEKLSLTSSSSEDSSDENFGDSCCATMTGHSAETYHRYYHVFRQGELDSLIEKYVHSLHILRSYYDHSNWCIVAERVQVWTI